MHVQSTEWPPIHKKSYGTCMHRRPFLCIPCTLHVHLAICTDLCAVKGGSIENHSYEHSTCTESCQRNTVSFTQYVSMHKSVGVWFECSSDFKLQGITYEVTATIEGQDVRLHALDGILLTWFNFSEWLHDSRAPPAKISQPVATPYWF